MEIKNSINQNNISAENTFKNFRHTSYNTKTTNNLERTPSNDTISTNKTVSNKTKKGLIIGGIALTGVIASLLIRGQFNKAITLAEHIDFKKAETIEEAIRFGKEHLGIKKYKNFNETDLDILNLINEGFVNTSNRFKGHANIPRKVVGKNAGDYVAAVNPLGTFYVNKEYYHNLDSHINKYMQQYVSGHRGSPIMPCLREGKLKYVASPKFVQEDIQPFIDQINRYKDGTLTSFDEKVELLNTFTSMHNMYNANHNAPLLRIRQILQNDSLKQDFINQGIETDLTKIKGLSIDEQRAILHKMIVHPNVKFGVSPVSRFKTIYHELGHLMDKNMRKRPRTTDQCDFNPEKYSKALKEWLNNDEHMQIVATVSDYAQHGPGEFIAETFARAMENKPIYQEAMDLYLEMGGKEIPYIPASGTTIFSKVKPQK